MGHARKEHDLSESPSQANLILLPGTLEKRQDLVPKVVTARKISKVLVNPPGSRKFLLEIDGNTCRWQREGRIHAEPCPSWKLPGILLAFVKPIKIFCFKFCLDARKRIAEVYPRALWRPSSDGDYARWKTFLWESFDKKVAVKRLITARWNWMSQAPRALTFLPPRLSRNSGIQTRGNWCSLLFRFVFLVPLRLVATTVLLGEINGAEDINPGITPTV